MIKYCIAIFILIILLFSCTSKTKEETHLPTLEDSLIFNAYYHYYDTVTTIKYQQALMESLLFYCEKMEMCIKKGIFIRNDSDDCSMMRLIDTLSQYKAINFPQRAFVLVEIGEYYNSSRDEGIEGKFYDLWENPDVSFIKSIKNLPDTIRFRFIKKTLPAEYENRKCNDIIAIFTRSDTQPKDIIKSIKKINKLYKNHE